MDMGSCRRNWRPLTYRISITVTLTGGVGDSGVFQYFDDQRMPMQSVVWADGPKPYPARVVLPSQIITQTRVEVPIDVEDVAFAMLARLDDGLVGGKRLANAKARGAVPIPADYERAIPDGCATPFRLLNSIHLDRAFAPRDIHKAGWTLLEREKEDKEEEEVLRRDHKHTMDRMLPDSDRLRS